MRGPTATRPMAVVVNDRGPFVERRDIHLSLAAEEVGLTSPGIAAARVHTLERSAVSGWHGSQGRDGDASTNPIQEVQHETVELFRPFQVRQVGGAVDHDLSRVRQVFCQQVGGGQYAGPVHFADEDERGGLYL